MLNRLNEGEKSRLKKVTTGAVITASVGFCYYLFVLVTGVKIPCVFNLYTGLLCSGCGITRMFMSIFKADFRSAFYYNRFVFVMLPVFAVFFVKRAVQYIRKGKCTLSKSEEIFLWCVTVAFILFGILRNIY